MTRQEHWNKVYETRGAHDVSWHQRRPDLSLELIAESGVSKDAGIIATFALDGPRKCTGLDVVRYDEQSICAELGSEFMLLDVRRETHITPWQSEQRFVYFRFRQAGS